MTLSTSRQRGTAMTETILALPFLLLIMLFIAYFGRSSVRVERTHMMARYQAVRSASQGPGPRPDVDNTHEQMNDTWFNNTADNTNFSGHTIFPEDAYQRWQDAAARRSDDAGSLLDQMLNDYSGGSTAQVTSRHNSSNKFLEMFNNDVHATHTVEDGDWKYVNGYPLWIQENVDYSCPHCGHHGVHHRWDMPIGGRTPAGPYDACRLGRTNANALRDTFYEGFDSTLEAMSSAQNPLASTIRQLYLDTIGYQGPIVNGN